MNQLYPRRWWALGALAVSLLTVGLDLTVLNVAVPTLAVDLGATTTQLQWFGNAYTLALAALLLPAGLLGDRFGPKKLLLGALAVFGLASLWCAFATSPGELIAARVVLGVGAAFLIPLSLSLLNVLFPPEERAKALTTWVLATFVGIPLGPLLGGWLLDHFAWGSVFLINVPLTVVGLVAVLFLVPLTRGSGAGAIDYAGIALSAAGLVALTYGFVYAGEHGWADPMTYGLVALGAALLAVFWWEQTRVAAPLADLGLFREPRFVWGAVLATVASFALMGLLFVLPQLFQAVQGADALQTGLRLLPLIGGMLVSAKIAERLVAVFGVRVVVTGGFLLLAAGLGWGSTTSAASGYGLTLGWEIVIGLGTGCTLPPLMSMAMGALTEGRSGAGSALIQVLRQVGGTIGVAVLGTVLNGVYRAGVAVDGLPGPVADAARGSASGAVAVAGKLHLPALADSARAAFADGMAATLWVCAGLGVAGAVLAVLFLPGRVAAGTEPRESEHDVVAG
ncbi:DHA2 family efflux MFS transporter permease subunit [Amycolatopsis sp., V23-08]|uniref:DHA2 family efflux MFS transporter permease subunit n=1 Tax=Amycolatopsis heterodermiae TaxID=3110235 RepID=A0ABU5QZH6_9PSEU|nr:DHA2 family efflux MFS transporter permease subunit [Amycolatopsis sp., V23-08]MEA5359333.1 DHA2 family efflux MFS transporter permease subunit [Amycolatopsis sp., V23-08]